VSEPTWGIAYHAGMVLLYDEHGNAVATFGREEDAQRAADAVNGVLHDAEVATLRAEIALREHQAQVHHELWVEIEQKGRERWEIAELELSLLRPQR
jgi:hypothetical protein